MVWRNMVGGIFCEEAYARGKMIDHTDLAKVMGRGSPSDIDFVIIGENMTVIDNRGRLLLVELSSKAATWEKLSAGQRRAYENLCQAGRGNIRCVLAYHETAEGSRINSLKDVKSFQVMDYGDDGYPALGGVISGEEWAGFVALHMR